MATLSIRPRAAISQKAIPQAIAKALHIIFKNCGQGVWLVGGTAIAGYYAEHRRSDDIDLFVQDALSFNSAHASLKALEKEGAQLENILHTPRYFHADAQYQEHRFTIDIVLDENVFVIGKGVLTGDGVQIADFDTLFAMKCACLVSRCSEKDLFDLQWFFEQKNSCSAFEIIQEGQKIDAGVCIESLLVSLQGAMLREEACNFQLINSKTTTKAVHRQVVNTRQSLISLLREYEKGIALPKDLVVLKDTAKQFK